MYSRAVLKSYIFMKYYMLSKNLWFQSNTMQSNYLLNVNFLYTSCCFQKWAGLPDALYTHFECSLRLCTGKTSQKNIFRSDIFNSFRFYHIQDIIEIPSKVFFNLFRRTINQLIFSGVFPIFANYSFIHTAEKYIFKQSFFWDQCRVVTMRKIILKWEILIWRPNLSGWPLSCGPVESTSECGFLERRVAQ